MKKASLVLGVVICFMVGLTTIVSAQIYYPEPPEVIGSEEIVFDWTTDKCEDLDIPDAPARAFRDADGNVQLIASHYVNIRMIGPDLASVEKDCNIIMNSDLDSDLSQHNNYEWLHGFYTEDGSTIYSIVHNENIPCGDWSSCWYNTLTFATSVDTGRTYTHEPAPNHFLAGIPYQYEYGAPMGIFGGSSPVFNPDDGYYYVLVHLEEYELQDWGTGVIRTQTLSDPDSWRGWDGSGFNVEFVDPYNETVSDPADHILEPVSRDNIGKMSSSLTYNTYFEKFMVVGKDWTSGGFAYSLSDDLINWSEKVALFPGPINQAGDLVVGWGAGGVLYPEIIDPADTTRNFENPGQEPYLYFTKWNEAANSLDRDLVRVQVRFSQDSIAVTEFTVNSIGDDWDNNLGDGDCTTGNTIASGENERTLRAAIMESNARPNGFDYPITINFDIPGTGVHTIELDSYLFEIEEPVIIDGYSQSGAVQNTNDFEDGLNFELMIEIDASDNGSGSAMSVKADNCTIKGLIINGGPFGVDYEEAFSSTAGYCTIQGNIIGYDATGTASASGYLDIRDCHNNQIGGLNPEDRNLISCVTFENSQYNVVQGNYFGTDITGTSGVIGEGGGLLGLDGYSQFNEIGGTEPNAGNVFAGSNLNAAIGLNGEHVNNNYLYGNLVGVNVTGDQAIGAYNYGVRLSNEANNNYIGTIDGGNVIGSNSTGVCNVLFEWSAHDNYFVGNAVGTDLTGIIDLNSQSGQGTILIAESAYHNIIGGTEEGEGNIIAYNSGKGIALSNSAGIGNGIFRNSIHSNGNMGIDLGQNGGPETNDLGDPDTGPNDLQNYPVITTANIENDTLFVEGSLNSLGLNTFRIEFFTNDECDATGYGEGETYLGFIDVTTDESGDADFETSFSSTAEAGQYITTTATDFNNNTSEFSQGVEVTSYENTAPVADDISIETDVNVPVEITLTGSDADGDELTFTVQTQPENGVLSGDVPNLTYSPNADWFGVDSFTYVANDGTVDSEIATVTITVNEEVPNTAPVADDISVETDENIAVEITLTGSDADGDELTFTVQTQPENGVLSGDVPNLVYTPNTGWFGVDSLTYVVNDGELDSEIATVTIVVSEVFVPEISILIDSLNFEVTEGESSSQTLTISNIGDASLEVELSSAGDVTCVDIDGNVYETVQIGDQIWMAENLKVTHYNDGQEIPTGYSNSEWAWLGNGAYCVYDDNESNADIYGYIYNWYAIETGNLAPEGWHIATDEEWTILTDYLGADAGSQLAENADLWNDGNLENNAEFGTSGFTGLPGGYRYNDSGNYDGVNNYGRFWSATADNAYNSWYRELQYNDAGVHRNDRNKQWGFSVRCIMDDVVLTSRDEWLNFTPTTLTIEPGFSADITVTVDATGLELGEYSDVITITSNDPGNSVVDVPVTLTVNDVINELDTPINVAVVIDGNNLTISWDVVANANSYLLYSSSDPYATFPDNWIIVDTVTDLIYTIESATEDKMFYCVVASTETEPVAVSKPVIVPEKEKKIFEKQ